MNDAVTMRRKLRLELKRLRAARGLTQREVAERLDWSVSKIIRIESGTAAVSATDLQALLDTYGVAQHGIAARLSGTARRGNSWLVVARGRTALDRGGRHFITLNAVLVA